MTASMVTVSIQVDGAPGDTLPPEGNYVFSPSGVLWPDTSGNAVAPQLQHGVLMPNTAVSPPVATASVQLVASDNFTAGVLTWDVIINVRGMPTVNVQAVPVNFASGANQNIWTILQAAGWTPVQVP